MEVSSRVDHDLFLVENQLPFFVLCDLFNEAFGVRFSNLTFKDVAWSFIRRTSLPGSEFSDTLAIRVALRDTSNIKHLVDCLRICYLPTELRCGQLLQDNVFPKTAKELKRAGVKFIALESKSLLNIKFSKGELHIPKLTIDDDTKSILRSVAFYEQCHCCYDAYIIDYLFFMDELIDTPEDAQILVNNKIFKNLLGNDEEVATLFNDVTKELVLFNSFYYTHLCRELNACANSKWNHWKAVLRRDYFNHPWAVISLIYAMVLLIVTVIQCYTGFKA